MQNTIYRSQNFNSTFPNYFTKSNCRAFHLPSFATFVYWGIIANLVLASVLVLAVLAIVIRLAL